MEEQDRSMCKETKLCEECRSNPSIYKCPGCSIRSCSLACVKAHKQRTGCTGKRNQTHFVPISQFDDNLLLSDYNLLEDMKRVAESARRMRSKFGAHFRLPLHLKSLRNAAGSRKTKLLFLYKGMSKREKNQSRYDNRKKFISWTIEWRFHQTDIVLVDHGVDENASFSTILEKHLKPGPWNHQLRKFCEEELDCLKLFIRKYPKGPKSPFKELDVKAPIREQLANVVILEFPVVHVFLPSHNVNFEVIKPVNPTLHKPLQRDCDGAQSPKGMAFREEEIEDDNSSPDPHILDLMKHLDSELSHQMPSQNKSSERAVNISSDGPLLEGDTAGDLSHSSPKSDDLDLSENMALDFDSNYMDIYSDLMALINPEDFIDYESELSNKPGVEGRDLGGVSGTCPVPEELEEGEIAE
ncbi:box C/D snoRNA protein 1-like [Neltuma alba]|uniref:box C/D snoRNA protein 1-like n=1 Tax=Neltuma alba TaxID=207710 RepID=UPI0010A53573|nr:box C/D snoRNA protein 1-like [Prosopis alba]